jgi:succinate dehydrogenase / fumarate reductase, membrane anchor subunit
MSAVRMPSPRAQGSFEVEAWMFMRVSGVVMLLIAVGHLLYMHLVTGVDNIDYAWILQRWANPVWRLYDWLLLAFALAHGTNGVRTVLDDYVPRGLRNVAVKWLLYVVAFTCLLMGSQIVATAPRP